MDTPAEKSPSGAPAPAPTQLQFELRTAPKLWPFLGAGAVAAAVVALIVAWFSHEANVKAAAGGPVEFSFGAVFGFFLVIFAIVGLAAGALAFLITDRVGRKRARTVSAVAQPVTEADPSQEA